MSEFCVCVFRETVIRESKYAKIELEFKYKNDNNNYKYIKYINF